MGRRVRLGSACDVDIEVDSKRRFGLILATWPLILVAAHALRKSSSVAVTLAGFGAAIGVFASLAVHEITQVLAVRGQWHQGALES